MDNRRDQSLPLSMVKNRVSITRRTHRSGTSSWSNDVRAKTISILMIKVTCNLDKTLAIKIVVEHHQTPHNTSSPFKLFFWDLLSWNVANKVPAVTGAIVNSFSSSQRIELIHYFPLEVNGGKFLSLLVAFRNMATKKKIKKKIEDKARVFWGSIVKTKHQRLTNLSFI